MAARFIATPDGARPVSIVAITAGGFALRSITESRLSGTSFFGSAGSSFMLALTSAIDSSGKTATFCGGPATLDGAFSSPTTLGGDAPRSISVTVSSTGFSCTLAAPSTSTTLPSFDETASCAAAPNESSAAPRSAMMPVFADEIRRFITCPPSPDFFAFAITPSPRLGRMWLFLPCGICRVDYARLRWRAVDRCPPKVHSGRRYPLAAADQRRPPFREGAP